MNTEGLDSILVKKSQMWPALELHRFMPGPYSALQKTHIITFAMKDNKNCHIVAERIK